MAKRLSRSRIAADDKFMILSSREPRRALCTPRANWSSAERYSPSAEQRQQTLQPDYRLLYSLRGYRYCDLLLSQEKPVAARRSRDADTELWAHRERLVPRTSRSTH